MILNIKAKECKQLPDGSWQLMTDCESLKNALMMHSPNILVDYLNAEHGTSIPRLPYNGKEDANGTV